MQANRALILRGNRFLGSTLVDKRFITVAQLEEANGRFMEVIQQEDSEASKISILHILINELKHLDENRLFEFYLDTAKIGLIDLESYRPVPARDLGYDMDLARATFSVPFDRIEGFTCVATCYYLSAPVVKNWLEHFDGKVIWYAASLKGVIGHLSRIRDLEESLDEAEEAAAEEAAAEAALQAERLAQTTPSE